MSETKTNAPLPEGRAEGGRGMNDLLAVRLLELAIRAGWQPGDCVKFAREAHEFVMSTLPEVALQQIGAGTRELAERIPRDEATNVPAGQHHEVSPDHHANGSKPFRKEPSSARPKGSIGVTGEKSPPQPSRPEWGPAPDTRRNALQALADQNRTMQEAAEILGISWSLVSVTATRLKISFHGRRNRKPRPAPLKNIKAVAKPAKRTPVHTPVNGEAVAKLLVGQAFGRPMQRRCPSCNQIFEPTQVNHYLCDSCESSSYVAK
jgi:hypothetical protein